MSKTCLNCDNDVVNSNYCNQCWGKKDEGMTNDEIEEADFKAQQLKIDEKKEYEESVRPDKI